MTSTNTYITTIPYFYIIQHKIDKKMYAGSKWATGCHPDTFMVKTGYTTSSALINSIIGSEGLDSFDILRIDTNLDGLSAYEYESLFLQTLDCAKSDEWYNQHNNTGLTYWLPEMLKKSKKTRYKKNNGKFRSKEELEKARQTNQDRYGYDYPTQCPKVKDQTKQTRYKKNNGKYNSVEQSEKAKQTNQLKYSVDNVFQNEEIKEKSKQTLVEKTGYDNTSKDPETKDKKKQTTQENWNVDNPSQSPIIQQKKKQTMLIKTGFNHNSKVPFLSIIETKKSYAKNILSRYFPELKQFYP